MPCFGSLGIKSPRKFLTLHWIVSFLRLLALKLVASISSSQFGAIDVFLGLDGTAAEFLQVSMKSKIA